MDKIIEHFSDIISKIKWNDYSNEEIVSILEEFKQYMAYHKPINIMLHPDTDAFTIQYKDRAYRISLDNTKINAIERVY